MALRFTPNSRSPNLSLSANVVARFSSVLSMDWDNITGKPAYVDAVDANVSTWLQVPTSANLRAALTDETGTGAAVFATSPVLVTPTLGVATATSLNGNFWTAGTGTLTIGAGKTLRSNNTLTFAGTDGTTLTFQGTDTYVGRSTTDTLTNKTFDTAGAGNSLLVNGTAVTANTGTGSTIVRSSSPTIATPDFTTNFKVSGNIFGSTLTAGATYHVIQDPSGSAFALQIGDGTDPTNYYKNTTHSFTNRAGTSTWLQISSAGLALFGGTSGNTKIAAAAAASGTWSLPAATDTFVGRATTDTLTNKTIDTSGPNTLKVGGVTLSAGQYPGETTTGSATAGNIGEFVSSNVLQASAAALTSGVILNVTSISLTAGDWDIYGVIGYIPGGTTTITRLGASIETSNSVFSSIAPNSTLQYYPSFAPGANAILFGVGPLRVSLSGTTSYYLNAVSTFATSTNAAFGYLRARRAR